MVKPTLWEAFGCSYRYNAGLLMPPYETWDITMTVTNGQGIAGRRINWVVDPTRYILMHEPPARRNGSCFYHWHYRRGPSDIHPPDGDWDLVRSVVKKDPQRFISPILFVDGHVATHDFTKVIRSNPQYCCEPTPDWIWYQPESKDE